MPATQPQPGTAPRPAGRIDARQMLVRQTRFLRRSWRLVLGWLFLVTAMACVVSWKCTRYTWQARAVLLYSAMPTPEQQKDLYTQPDLKTLTAFVSTPRTFEALRDEFQLAVPAKAIERNLEVINPPGTRMLQLALRWDDGELARKMLDRLIELYGEQVADLRRKKLDGHLADYVRASEEARQQWQKAMGSLHQFHRREGIADLKQDQSRKTEELQALGASLALARRNRSNAQVQLAQLDDHIRNLKSSADKEVDKSKEFEAAEETVADNRRRQDRLRELISEERKIEETKSQLVVRRREVDRLRPLVARGLKTRGDLDRVEAEIGVLAAQIQESDKIREWKKELERIDKVVVPKGKQKSQGSPIIQQTLFRRLELELQLTGYNEEISQLEAAQKQKEQDLDRFSRLHPQADNLTREVEAADAQRQRVEGQIAALRQLKDLGPNEFVVVTPATTGPYPMSSNRKLLLAGTLGAGLFLGIFLLVGFDLFHYFRSSEGVARRLGLPIVSRITTHGGDFSADFGVRSLALEIRQHIDHAGSVLLISPVGSVPEMPRVLDALAACLARRDERVLVLDASHGSPDREGPGLSDYLAFHCDTPEEILRPGDRPGVDYLANGAIPPTVDAMATHRMRDLIETLQQRYTILLILGPTLDHAVDLTILASMSDAMLLAVGERPGSVQGAQATLAALTQRGLPVLGQVLLTVEDEV